MERRDEHSSGHNTPDASHLASSSSEQLARQSWKNWFLAVASLIVVTVGLATSLLSVLGARESAPWPWVGSQEVLLGGLSVLVALFGAYLTRQQRQLERLRKELLETHELAMAKTKRHYDRLMALHGISQTVAQETSPQAVFESIVKMAFESFEADQVSLMLLDRANGELKVRAALGHNRASEVMGASQKCGEGISGWVAEHKQPLILGPEVNSDRFRNPSEVRRELTAALVVPIVLRDELVGVLNVSSRVSGRSYDDEDLRVLQVFAGSAGVVIRHTEQADWMRQTIHTLERSLEGREDDKAA